MRNWYRIEAAAAEKAPTVADVYVYDQIGKSYWDDNTVTAAKFVADLQALPASVKTIRVHVSSPGGNVFEATAIANALRAERSDNGRTVEMRIDGIAASAATIITSAGSPIRIADNAMMMIHEPSATAMGPSSVMRKLADTLDAVRNSIIAAYRWVSSKTEEELGAMMAETTWMDAKAALDAGFATEIVEGKTVTACFDPEAVAGLGEIPEAYRPAVEALVRRPNPAPAPTPAPVAATADEILDICEAGDCVELAKSFRGSGATVEQVTARVAETKAAKAAASQRASEIAALCKTAKQETRAALYVRSGLNLDDIKADLANLTAQLDRVEIDANLKPDAAAGGGRRPTIDTVAIYDRFNQRTAK